MVRENVTGVWKLLRNPVLQANKFQNVRAGKAPWPWKEQNAGQACAFYFAGSEGTFAVGSLGLRVWTALFY